jgi:hypothetical protein
MMLGWLVLTFTEVVSPGGGSRYGAEYQEFFLVMLFQMFLRLSGEKIVPKVVKTGCSLLFRNREVRIKI